MARHRRTLEEQLADAAGQSRATAGLSFSTPALAPITEHHIVENAIQKIHIAVGAIAVESFDEALTGTVNDLVHGVDRIDNEILPAITEAANSPITDERLAEGTLTLWPFAPNTMPAGTVGSDELADFSVVIRKLKSDRHHIY
jgi:hypothetical protein